jgi:hypothetical protein
MPLRKLRDYSARNKALQHNPRLLIVRPAAPARKAGVDLQPSRRDRLWVVRSDVRKVHCPLHKAVVNDPPLPRYGNNKGLGAPLTLHRYLIHHVLSQRGFNPPGIVFPVSAAILERIAGYKAVLESYSARLLPFIEWEVTPKNNVRVLNETADYYRFPDLTLHAEFLFEAVAKTIREDLPKEAAFLERYDRFRAALQDIIDMPEVTANLLFRFLDQNDGTLSKRAREKEFAKLDSQEVAAIEALYIEIFETAPPAN